MGRGYNREFKVFVFLRYLYHKTVLQEAKLPSSHDKTQCFLSVLIYPNYRNNSQHLVYLSNYLKLKPQSPRIHFPRNVSVR